MPPRKASAATRRPAKVADSHANDPWAAAARAHLTAQEAERMSDEAGSGGQAPTQPEGQAPNTNTDGQAPAASENQTDATRSQREAQLEAEVKALRAENAKHRKRNQEDEARRQQEVEANLSEAERAKAEAERAKQEAAKLREQLTATALRAEVAARANALKIVDPDAALALMDRDLVAFGDDGRPVGTSVQTALEALVAAKPYLAPEGTPAPPPSGGPPANPARGPQGSPAETLDAKRARIYGGTPQTGNPLLDPEAAKAAGGGVVFVPPANG